jgi:ketosteroid isomerase-like protein
MEGARTRARRLVEELTSAWLAGHDDTVSSVCTADVDWWTPATGGTASGPTATSDALRGVLAPLRHPVTVTAVVPSDDGTRCVVEMRSAVTPDDAAPSFVTSVISLRDGKISGGRTYTDLQGHGRQPSPETS